MWQIATGPCGDVGGTRVVGAAGYSAVGAGGVCAGLVGVGEAAGGHVAGEAAKLLNVEVEGGVDVDVVELDAGDDGRAGAVVEELGVFVEVGAVVFVTFDGEVGSGAEAEVFSGGFEDAADEVAGVFTAGGEGVGGKGGGGGFAVGAADDDGVAVFDEEVSECFGEAGLDELVFACVLGLDVGG